MEQETAKQTGITKSVGNLFFSCTEQRYQVREHLIPEHGISHVYAGEMEVTEGNRKYIQRAGESILFKRNHLARMVKKPIGDRPFKSASIFLTQSFLREYYPGQKVHGPASAEPASSGNFVTADAAASGTTSTDLHDATIPFGRHPLLASLFDSILPYYDLDGPLPEELERLKLQEAMTILRTIDNGRIYPILADIPTPGKIDLAEFMQKNFTFNIPLERFSYLTGRSLATFKRDFQKTFSISPRKWLLEQRLQKAHYLIAEQGWKTSDVYLEVGFENLSHFSASFKQKFGYNPSSIQPAL